MINYNIIGFCGRLQSGKTTLANICEEYGYGRIYFALPLKQLISQLFHISIDDINRLKNVDSRYVLQDVDMKFLADETNIPFQVIKDTLSTINYTFKNTREILQFIGTDIIRAYNKDWHVNKIKEMIEPNKKYVIDDIRFPNELHLVESLGGSIWYVARPKLDNVSNHISETSIRWQDIDNILVNDCSLEFLKIKWKLFMENGYEQSMKKRTDTIEMLLSNEKFMDKYLTIDNPFTLADSLFISRYEFLYDVGKWYKVVNVEIDNEGQNHILKVTYENNLTEFIKNPLLIEDYKFKMFENK